MTDYQTKIDTIESHRSNMTGDESLADTPWSALFHEARTMSSPFTSASVGVRVTDDGELEVSDVAKTRQGEHVRWPDK